MEPVFCGFQHNFLLKTFLGVTVFSTVVAAAFVVLASVGPLPWRLALYPTIAFSAVVVASVVAGSTVKVCAVAQKSLNLSQQNKSTTEIKTDLCPVLTLGGEREPLLVDSFTPTAFSLPTEDAFNRCVPLMLADFTTSGKKPADFLTVVQLLGYYATVIPGAKDVAEKLMITNHVVSLLKSGKPSDEIKSSIKALIFKELEAGHEVIFPGGWINPSVGHAVWYRFYPVEAGDAQPLYGVELINTGSAGEFLPTQESCGYRGLRLAPVSLEALQRSLFLDVACDYRLLPPAGETNYRSDEWFSTLPAMWPSNSGEPAIPFDWGKGQRGPTCINKGLMRWLLKDIERMGDDKAAAAKFKWEFKCALLTDYINNCPIDKLNVKCIEDVLPKMSRSLDKLVGEGILDETAIGVWGEKKEAFCEVLKKASVKQVIGTNEISLAGKEELFSANLAKTQMKTAPKASTEHSRILLQEHSFPPLEAHFSKIQHQAERLIKSADSQIWSQNLVEAASLIRLLPPATSSEWDNIKDAAVVAKYRKFFNDITFLITREASKRPGQLHLPEELQYIILKNWFISWKLSRQVATQEEAAYLDDQKRVVYTWKHLWADPSRLLDPVALEDTQAIFQAIHQMGGRSELIEDQLFLLEPSQRGGLYIFNKFLKQNFDIYVDKTTAEDRLLFKLSTKKAKKSISHAEQLKKAFCDKEGVDNLLYRQMRQQLDALYIFTGKQIVSRGFHGGHAIPLSVAHVAHTYGYATLIWPVALHEPDATEQHMTTVLKEIEAAKALDVNSIACTDGKELPFLGLHKELAVNQLINFFQGKESLLVQPLYQRIFFAQQEGLLYAFSTHSEQINRLFEFVEAGYAKAIALQNPQLLAFFFHLQLTLCQQSHFLKHKDSARHLHNFQKQCEEFLRPLTPLPEGSYFFLGQVATQGAAPFDSSLHDQSEQILPALIALRIKGMHSAAAVEGALPFIDPVMVDYGIQVMLGRLAASRQLARRAGDIVASGQGGSFRDSVLTVGADRYDLKRGTTIKGDSSSRQWLPPTIVQDVQFLALFGNNKNFMSQKLPHGGFSFVYRGDTYQVAQEGGELLIQKRINNAWYSYQLPAPIPTGKAIEPGHPCKEGYLVSSQGLAHWKSADGALLIEDIKRRRFLACVHQGKVEKSSKKGQGKSLYLCLHPPEPVGTLLKNIEEAGYILPWADANGKVTMIELPRLKMKFHVDDQGRLSVSHLPGFYVGMQPPIEGIHPFKDFIFLQNGAGEKRLLIPDRFIKAQPIRPYEPFELPTNHAEVPSGAPYIFRLDSKGLTASSRREEFFLVYLYLYTREYAKAIELFQAATFHQKPLQPEEHRILQELLVSTTAKGVPDAVDNHPHALSLRLQIADLLGVPDLSPSTSLKERWKNDACAYNNQRNNVFPFSLKAEQIARFPPSASQMTAIPKAAPIEDKNDLSWIHARLAKTMRAQKQVAPLRSFTRPGEPFIHNFLIYYRIALEGDSESKEILRQILHASAYDQDPQGMILRHILCAALTEPESLPGWCDVHKKIDKKEFQKTFLEQVKKISLSPFFSLQIGPAESQRPARVLTKRSVDVALEPVVPLMMPSLKPLSAVVTENFYTKEKSNHAKKIATLTQLEALYRETPSKDPVVQTEFEKLHQGVVKAKERLQAEQQVEKKQLHSTCYQTLAAELRTKLGEEKKEQERLAEAIMHQARTVNDQHLLLEIMGDIRTELTLPELLIFFAKGDDKLFLEANPSLAGAVGPLKQKIFTYLLHATRCQQLENGLKKLEEWERAPTEAKATANEAFFAVMDAVRPFDPVEKPHLLVFEYFSHCFIRADQWKALSDLTHPDLSNLVEAYTGFGKSKVVIPCYLAMTAVPGKLSCVVVPEPLLEETEQTLHGIMRDGYHKVIHSLTLQRKEENLQEALKRLIKDVALAKSEGRALLMSTKTLHNLLVLLPKETFAALEKEQNNQELLERRDLCLELRRSFLEASVFFEEPHITLNDQCEFNWSIGKPSSVTAERCAPVVHLYQCFFSHPEVRKLQLDFMEQISGTEPFSRAQYDTVLKPALIAAYCAMRKEPLTGGLRAYLMGESKLDNVSEEWRVLRNQLNHYLPNTLERHCNEQYGLADPEKDRKAIPWDSAGGPKKGSEFSTLDELLNFTLQANFKTAFSQEEVNETLDALVERALIEEKQGAGGVSVKQIFSQLLRALGLSETYDIYSLGLKEREAIYKALSNPERKEGRLQWIAMSVLPTIEVYKEKVRSTPHELANSVGSMGGASATLGMKNIPTKVETKENPESPIKTLINLYDENKNITIMHSVNSRDFLEELLGNSSWEQGSVLVDVGALCRDYIQDKDAALRILEVTSGWADPPEGVVFFQGGGLPMYLLRGAKKAEPLAAFQGDRGKLFWYYSQSFITGIDQTLSYNAVLHVTCSGMTPLTEVQQGVGRGRGVGIGQKARIVFPRAELQQLYETLGEPTKDTLSIDDFLRFLPTKQGKRRGQNHYASLARQWEAIVTKRFWEDPSGEIFTALRSFLVIPIEDTAAQMEIDTSEHEVMGVIEQQKTKFLKKLEASIGNNPFLLGELDKIKREIDETIHKEFYPEKVKTGSTAEDIQQSEAAAVAEAQTDVQQQNIVMVTVQQAATAQAQQVAAQESQQELQVRASGLPPAKRKGSFNPYQPHSAVNSLLNTSLFDEKLAASEEFFRLLAVMEGTPCLLSGYLKPLEYLCITCDDRGQITQVTLLDQTDAADLDKTLVGSEPPPSGTVMLWGIRQGMLRQSGAVVSQEVMKKDLTFQRLHLQAKVLNGDFIFSPKEQALFEGWKKGMDATEWKTLCSCICTARPNALRRAKRTAL